MTQRDERNREFAGHLARGLCLLVCIIALCLCAGCVQS